MHDAVHAQSPLTERLYPPAISLREIWPYALLAVALLRAAVLRRRRRGRDVAGAGPLRARVRARRPSPARLPLPLSRGNDHAPHPADLRGCSPASAAACSRPASARSPASPPVNAGHRLRGPLSAAAAGEPRRGRSRHARRAAHRRPAHRPRSSTASRRRPVRAGLRLRLRAHRARQPAAHGVVARGRRLRRRSSSCRSSSTRPTRRRWATRTRSAGAPSSTWR